MPLSSALVMSYTVSAATAAAVIASISTPVGPVELTLVVISMPRARTAASTSMCDKSSGWQSGIKSEVRLAAEMPAMRAISSGLPLGFPASWRSTEGRMVTNARARAVRVVSGFPPTSTIRTSPSWP